MTLRHYLFILSFLTAITFVTAQQNLISAKTHINQKAKFWGLDKDDYEDIFVSSEAVSEKGITYMYLNQAYKGIPIRNAMMTVIMDQHGKVVSDAHNLVAQIGKKINTLKPAVTPAAAIINSAAHLGLRIKETPVSGSRSSDRIQ